MSFHGEPQSKAGAGALLQPTIVSYEESLKFTNPAFSFGFAASARSHAIYVRELVFPTAANPVVAAIDMAETAVAEYQLSDIDIGWFFDSAGARKEGIELGSGPGTAVFKEVNGTPYLLVDSTVFVTEGKFYVVGVAELPTPGVLSAIGPLIDVMVVYVQPKEIPVIASGASAGIDLDALEWVLGLAGHNLKTRDATYANGTLASYRLVLFDSSLTISSTPGLLDSQDDTGKTSRELVITVTPDALQEITIEETQSQ